MSIVTVLSRGLETGVKYFFSLLSRIKLSYLPPLMVYMAAGVSGLTSIVGTFFIKEYLSLSPEFLAMLGFWTGLPWAMKMVLGHLVDLIWRWKWLLVVAGASLIAASLTIMLLLIGYPDLLVPHMELSSWFVLAAILSPVGYVIQDAVADAMTVEAVAVHDEYGVPYLEEKLQRMHTTMQTLGRVAIVGGTVLVSLINIILFKDIELLGEVEKIGVYVDIYKMAMVIPLLSVSGVILAELLHRSKRKGSGKDRSSVETTATREIKPNWQILGGGLGFVIFTMVMGLTNISYNQEIIFAGTMAIVLFLMNRLLRELSPSAKRTLVATAVVIFVFRALPGPGAGASWWQIDELGFDQQFLSKLGLLSSVLALFGMGLYNRFLAGKSINYIVLFLTVFGSFLSLPIIGMYYGLHEWTATMTYGVVDARSIAVVDTVLESPLGQIAMIPMLAWIAGSAPTHLKATFFAVMASFTNLALSLSSLLTKYLNHLFTISREVVEPLSGLVVSTSDYSELGVLLITVTGIGLTLPPLAVYLTRRFSFSRCWF